MSGRKTKNILFTLLAVLLPLLFLAALELLLRLFNYGGDLRLVRTVEIYGKKYYQLNSQVGRRYFRSKYLAVPEMFPEVFAYDKPDSLVRIFVLGGSTTAGFPFEMNARFTSLMEARLNRLFRGRYEFEVINVGMSAINSFSVLDFMDELVRYKPDVFLIYMGHNEFYGALGVGSTESLGKNRALILLDLKLSRFRVFRLLRDALFGLRRIFSRHPLSKKEQATLMENVVRNRRIPFRSEEYELAKRFYRENLREIIRKAKRSGAKVLVSSLVCNLKDRPPFIADFSAGTPPEVRQRWEKYVREGDRLLAAGDFLPAAQRFFLATRLDDNHAAAYFHLGRSWQGAARYDSARTAYRAAADRDELRFRASSEWNQVIAEEAGAFHCPVVPMEAAFAAASPHGITGKELIFEHLHPNFRGYCLMAQTFLEALRRAGIPEPARRWPPLKRLSPEEWMRLAHVTRADLAMAEWRIRKLTSRWPFVSRPDYSRLQPHTWLDSLALRYIQHEIPWSEVHYRAAKHWEAESQPDSAIAEYAAIAAVRPDAYFPRFRIGWLYLNRKNPRRALPYLQQAWRLNPNSPVVAYWLGTCYLFLKKPEAVGLFQKALQLDRKKPALKPEERLRLRYALSLGLVQIGRSRAAVPHLEWIVKHFPRFAPAKSLLDKIRRGEKVQIEFK